MYPDTFVIFFFFRIQVITKNTFINCLYRKKWLKMESNKTSSVVGYHIEMPANARLRSSGFVAWDFFFFLLLSGCSEACPKDFSDRTLSNKQRPKKRDDRQGKRVGGSLWKSRQPVCMPRRVSKEQNKSQTKNQKKKKKGILRSRLAEHWPQSPRQF